MTEDSEIAKIKAWLKKHGRDRYWFADQTASHKRTVDNWLSAGQPIPEAKLALIKRLMADDEAAEARRRQQLDPVAQVFSLETDLPTFRAYSAAAKANHQTLEEWCITELNNAAEEWFSQASSHQRTGQNYVLPPLTDITLNEIPAKPFSPDEMQLLRQAGLLSGDTPGRSADTAAAPRTPSA